MKLLVIAGIVVSVIAYVLWALQVSGRFTVQPWQEQRTYWDAAKTKIRTIDRYDRDGRRRRSGEVR
jgi:hypothetical protein